MALILGAMPSSANAPRSIAQITKDAQDYEFNALVPLKHWLRTAGAMIRQAQVYTREGDDEMAYFLLFRHAHLVLSNLATHPEWIRASAQAKSIQQEVQRNLETLDELKPGIARRHDEYMKAAQARQARREAEATNRRPSQTSQLLEQDIGRRSDIQQLRGEEHAHLAARLAGQEFSKRSLGQNSNSLVSQREDQTDLASRMQAIRSRVSPFSPASYKGSQTNTLASEHTLSTGFNYPSVPHTERISTMIQQPSLSRMNQPQEPVRSPTLPPKPPKSQPMDSTMPQRPEKVAAPSVPAKLSNEAAYSFTPEAYLENGLPLRTMFLPPTLRTTFLRLAYKNTLKNLETCGFLAGTLRANALFVNTLIVPEQTATSDTCEMTDESELFDYVDQHDLMILGWIHTHPTQTCFMSSRDLHTHSGYQMMLAESIAIVCAPSKGDTSHGGDWGAYRLTDPPGKMSILQCDKPGIFHPHEVDNIYTDAMKPGHVMEILGMDFQIVDLRHSK